MTSGEREERPELIHRISAQPVYENDGRTAERPGRRKETIRETRVAHEDR